MVKIVPDTNELTCNKCGWVHFGVSRESAEDSVKVFNEYFDSLTEEKQQNNYGGKKDSIESYEKCSNCGNTYEDFRQAIDDDCPLGVTIGPIINSI